MYETCSLPQEQVIDRKPEKCFNMESADRCLLWDENGESHFLSDVRQGGTVILIFLRHFLDYITNEYVEDYNKVSKEDLMEANIQIIFIGCAPSKFIRHFKLKTKCSFNIFCDAKRILYKVLGLHDHPVHPASNTSVHVKSNYFVGSCKTMYNFFRSQEYQGDVFQQGGQVVIDESGEIIYFHREKHCLDHTLINDILNITNLPKIDLENMYKVKNI